MAEKEFKFRSNNGKIFEMQDCGERLGITTGQATRRLNDFHDQIKSLIEQAAQLEVALRDECVERAYGSSRSLPDDLQGAIAVKADEISALDV